MLKSRRFNEKLSSIIGNYCPRKKQAACGNTKERESPLAMDFKKQISIIRIIEVSDAFFNNEYFEYDEFIQCTMHPRVQRIKTNAECSHSISFVAACGIRDIHLLAAW